MNFSSIADGSASYLIIFIYGFLTSFHCIGMCGGFVLAGSTSKEKNIKTTLFYNFGRIISYTIAGFIVGSIGSLFVITGIFKGILPFIGGLFMIFMALNFLGILKKFKIQLPKLNKVVNIFLKDKNKNMFFMGLISALLPCGPMQGMQFYSLSSASPLKGAAAMFTFAIGTVPVLFLFGVFSNLLNMKFRKAALNLSAYLLIVMGICMVNRSLVLFGVDRDVLKIWTDKDKMITATVNENEQILITEFNDERFDTVAFKKGIPAKWIINVDKKYVGECKASIDIPEYNIKMEFKEGRNVISFTPDEGKEIIYSSICGMLSNKIIIYE
ncbi:MAG: sulfite exporter TauE/SafE family protein [Clostridium sp.]